MFIIRGMIVIPFTIGGFYFGDITDQLGFGDLINVGHKAAFGGLFIGIVTAEIVQFLVNRSK